jgi:hypothetical protein
MLDISILSLVTLTMVTVQYTLLTTQLQLCNNRLYSKQEETTGYNHMEQE